MIEVTCQVCGVPFQLYPSQIKSGRRFCSSACAYKGKEKWLRLVCQFCSRPFPIKPHEVAKGHGKYCSAPCAANGRKIPPEDRFWSKVDRSGGASACWPWLPANHSHRKFNYGHFTTEQGHQVLAHRYVWGITFGPIPQGMNVCHRCDNPPCCNPAHLFLGDDAANVADRETKGRGANKTNGNHSSITHPERTARGERQWAAKLTERQVGEIRQIGTSLSLRATARQFGVNEKTVKAIREGRTWKHLLVS